MTTSTQQPLSEKIQGWLGGITGAIKLPEVKGNVDTTVKLDNKIYIYAGIAILFFLFRKKIMRIF